MFACPFTCSSVRVGTIEFATDRPAVAVLWLIMVDVFCDELTLIDGWFYRYCVFGEVMRDGFADADKDIDGGCDLRVLCFVGIGSE